MIDTKKLRQVAQRKGVATFYGLAKELKAAGYLCSDSQAQRLWEGKTDPKLSTLVRLCAVLDCEIADITENPLKAARRQRKDRQ